MTLIALFWTLSNFSSSDCDGVLRPRSQSVTLNITLWYSRNKWRSSRSFADTTFRADSPFLQQSFVYSTCALFVVIPWKWIPRYLRLTSPLQETTGIAFPTVLFFRACTLLALMLDSISWHHCDTFSTCTWPAVTAVWVSSAVLKISPRLQVWASEIIHYCSDLPVPSCRHCSGVGTGESLVEVPLSVVGEWRFSFQVAWQPFFAPSHLESVELTQHCKTDSISSLNFALLYASSASTATARFCSFLWNLSETPFVNLAACFKVAFSPLVYLGLAKVCFSFLGHEDAS